MSAAYSFISTLNIRLIRKLLKWWRCKQSGNKCALVARAFLHLRTILLSGKTISVVMNGNSITQRFDSWLTQRVTLDNRSPLYLIHAPTDSSLFKELDAKEVEAFKMERLNLESSTGDRSPVESENRTGARNTLITEPVPCASEENREPVSASNVFSISEFARLCIIMRDDEDAKGALM